MARAPNRLIYFTDPMCSWCYGISSALTKVVEQLDDNTAFDMVMGGLRPYSTETMATLRDFLRRHWQEVSARSGQEFNYEILEQDDFIYDTEPACRAVALMQVLKPYEAFEFFKAVQKAFYQDNKNTNHTDTYLDIAATFGIDREAFRTAFESNKIKALVKKDFAFAAQLGVHGFPTLVLVREGRYYLLTNGYMTADQIISRIRQISLQFESDSDKHR